MANDTITTLVGNITADPELRFTQSGNAVTNFTVASTPRRKDGNEWVDGETLFIRCTVWREMAESVADLLHKGSRVIVHGRLLSQSWEDSEGVKRTTVVMDVIECGPSLLFAKSSEKASEKTPTKTAARRTGQKRENPPF